MLRGFTGAQAADGHAVFHHVGNDIDLRHVFDEALTVFLHRRMIEVAEPAREDNQVQVAEGLAAKQQI